MSRSAAEVLEEALALPEEQRAQVAEELVASLDGEVDPEAESGAIAPAFVAELEVIYRGLAEGRLVGVNHPRVKFRIPVKRVFVGRFPFAVVFGRVFAGSEYRI